MAQLQIPRRQAQTLVQIGVSVPSLLRDCTGDQTRFSLEAATLQEALHKLLTTYPLLRLHLYDEAERLRKHVLLYYNEQNITWLDRLDVPLRPGDRLAVLQNVSGG
ncbi:MAG: MoaD/ThiS family protein [Chloroflexota bacterium]